MVVVEQHSQAAWNVEVEREAEAMLGMPLVECPLKHTFTPGMYMRTITMPTGCGVIGAEHKTEHVNVIHRGHALVAMDGHVYEITAPFAFVSRPGTRKCLVILEEMEWSTFHPNPTDTRDLKELEALLIEPSGVREEYLRQLEALKLHMEQPSLNVSAGGAS